MIPAGSTLTEYLTNQGKIVTDNVIVSLTGTYVDEMETEWDIRLNGGAGDRVGIAVNDYFLLGVNLRVNYLFGTG